MDIREVDSDWYRNTSLVSRVLFWWTVPFFKASHHRPLRKDDLHHIPTGDDCSTVWQQLNRSWEAELKRSRNPNLLLAVCKTFAGDLILPGILLILSDGQMFLQPYLVNQMLKFFDGNSTVPRSHAVIYATCLACSALMYVLVNPHTYFQANRVSMKIKAALTAMVYRKVKVSAAILNVARLITVLRLNSKSFQHTYSGLIINLIATDVEKCEDSWWFLGLWLIPLWTALVVYLMFREFGSLFLFGVATCVVVFGINVTISYIYGKLRTTIADWGDRRMKAIKEIIYGMKVVKMSCWEDSLTDVVQDLRRNETRYLAYATVLRCLNLSLSTLSDRLIMFAIFTSGWWLRLPTQPSSVILAIGLLEIYQVKCRYAVNGLENWLQLSRSLQRIQEFLALPEHGADRLKNIPPSNGLMSPGVANIQHIYAGWWNSDQLADVGKMSGGAMGEMEKNKYPITSSLLGSAEKVNRDYTTYQIQNFSLRLEAGQFTAITGEVGSGKSSLLLAILGELPTSRGEIQICGEVGYVQQQPWIFHGTIRENIVMSQEFDEQRYHQIIYVCALTKDIEMMPHGDQTLVGERGLMLSGGQKTRVALARTIYRKVPIYLLDDPLSAVDTDVGKHIFKHCICGFLSGATRVLVTHQLQYLKAADRIVIMKAGYAIGEGSFNQLFEEHIKHNLTKYILKQVDMTHTEDVVKRAKVQEKENAPSVEEEWNEEGSTSRQVYLEYFKAGYGWIFFSTFCLLALLATILLVLGDMFLLRWTTGTSEANCSFCSSDTISQEINQDQLRYTVFSGCSWLVFPLSYVALGFFVSLVSRNFHQRVFPAVMSAKMRFFESQPIGRIANRFSRDMSYVDIDLFRNIWSCTTKGVIVVMFLGMLCYVNYWLTLALVPVLVSLYLLAHISLPTTRQLKRLEASLRSPIFSFVVDTISGLPSIRSMNMCTDYIEKFNRLQDSHSAALFTVYATDRWFTLSCLIVFTVYFIVAIFSLILMKDVVSSDIVSLSVIYLLGVAFKFQVMMRSLCATEIQMTSVERILAYTKLAPEAARTSNNPPPYNWPSSGEIVLRDVSLKYYEDAPLILRNINISIKGREKIGIVGRTGAGKSSLVTLLLRLAEPTGEILIDNIDVKKIGLHELRRNISVIPQDPILFGGSLRYNLDMFNERLDSDIWDVLQEVRMKDAVEQLPGQLDAELSEGGNNFSVGERQLLCLARTILRQNKILILDEATANLDYRTDNIIQETIRRKFSHCTVLTVAHRLQTIMDSDRIMVLDGGEVQEFDTPQVLLQKEDGYFKRLVEKSGLSLDPVLK